MKEYYESIFRRRSMRKFDSSLHLFEDDLIRIREQTEKLIPLDTGIKVIFELVARGETSAKWGEYCLLMYSEKKPGYLINAGYMLQQMDLWFASQNIGACWYGMAKPESKKLSGLDYVIMLAFGRSTSGDFRTVADDFKRKDISEIWDGEFDPIVKTAVRLSPSACNSQPWRYISRGNSITVYRYTMAKSIMPPVIKPYFNTIDIGISLCHLEAALEHEGYSFTREIFSVAEKEDGLIKIAEYKINRS
jgi:nitroreductase